MKRAIVVLVVLAAVVLTTAAPATAQVPLRVLTRPKVPSAEVVERLGLAVNWHVRVPSTGPRDYIAMVQILPRGVGDKIRTEIVVQTTAGSVFLFDGETGALRWNTPVGIRYSPITPVAGNSHSIILTRRDYFYMLDRDTGIQRVYRKDGGERLYGVKLEGIPLTAPAASEDIAVITFIDRVTCYALPDFDRIAQARYKDPQIVEQEKEGSVQPLQFWTHYEPSLKPSGPAVITPTQVALPLASGVLQSFNPGESRERIRYEYRTLDGLAAGIGHHGDIGYVGGLDSYVYALDLDQERLVWRFPSGAAIRVKPEVNDADVFVTSGNRGLFRLNRFTGLSYWMEGGADRFLAAHYAKDAQGKFKVDKALSVLGKYVYALDPRGKLVILDGDRGGVLAQYDTSDWQMPVANEWTDRIYFANTDGQVLCLRPRDSRTPQVNRSMPTKTAPPKDEPTPKKKEEEKKDEKKDEKAVRLSALRTEPSPGRLQVGDAASVAGEFWSTSRETLAPVRRLS